MNMAALEFTLNMLFGTQRRTVRLVRALNVTIWVLSSLNGLFIIHLISESYLWMLSLSILVCSKNWFPEYEFLSMFWVICLILWRLDVSDFFAVQGCKNNASCWMDAFVHLKIFSSLFILAMGLCVIYFQTARFFDVNNWPR